MIRDAIIINVILLTLYGLFLACSNSNNPLLRNPANEVSETLKMIAREMESGLMYVQNTFEKNTQ